MAEAATENPCAIEVLAVDGDDVKDQIDDEAPPLTPPRTDASGASGHLGGSLDAEDNHNIEEHTTSTATRSIIESRQLLTEMREQNYDVIRFATYRTACKLRFLQKKVHLHLVDIWNMIEAFRENGLNSLEHHMEVNIPKVETLITSIYCQLNKRLPTNAQINAEECGSTLLTWLVSAFDQENKGRMRVFSVKVALTTLSSGKLMDKLRYVFTQVSDSSGYLVKSKFDYYLKEVLALPTAVLEGPSFGYSDTASKSCFDGKTKVNVNDFLDTLMSDPGPQCLMWMPILHRMAQTENVLHPVQCEACSRESFMGFRYKCQRCYNYHLCQECFWRGRVSGNHNNDHEMKEYTSYKSPTKQLSHSLRKSFRCVPSKSNNQIPRFPETPEKTLDLSYIVPATPQPVHNGFHDSTLSHSMDLSSMESSSTTRSPNKLRSSIDNNRIDDEHRLIARYAARLAADANNASRSPTEMNFALDSNRAQRELISQLEAKNRDIMKEIQRLRLEQEQQAKRTPLSGQRNPTLLAELRLLRQRRDELEARMSALQESRKELMVQLEGLMKLLKNHSSPRSTPNSSPRARCAYSPPVSSLPRTSAPTTPGDSLMGVGGDVRQAFGQHQSGHSTTSSVRSLRNDLLVAADSVTNAMSSLVKELNSEASDSDEDDHIHGNHLQNFSGDEGLDDVQWQHEMQQRIKQENEFLAELRKVQKERVRPTNGTHENNFNLMGHSDSRTDDENLTQTDEEILMRTDEEDAELYDQDPKELAIAQDTVHHRYNTTDDESYGVETDQESYIRTDEEDGGNTEWEETMRRWVNR